MDRSISLCGALCLSSLRRLLFVAGLALVATSTTAFASEPCGTKTYPFPYTDVASVTDPFCPGIMEAYVTGISKGTTPTTFSPNNNVPRLQMTTFLQRTVDQVLSRGSRRAALKQWWIPQNTNTMQTIGIGGQPALCAADGENVWIANFGQVVQVQASTGKVIGTWTGAAQSYSVVPAAGKLFVAAQSAPGKLYLLDPTLPPGAVTLAAFNLGNNPFEIAFDGTHLWTANLGSPGSVSIITPTSPYSVVTVTAGFNEPIGVLFDGASIWVTDQIENKLFKLDTSGNIVQTVTVGSAPQHSVFDGANIWVPNGGDSSITVVQASTGNVVATINGDATNQLSGPTSASFDGERILVTNEFNSSITIFKATDLSFIANVATGVSTEPIGACSDGINFWVDLQLSGNLLRL